MAATLRGAVKAAPKIAPGNLLLFARFRFQNSVAPAHSRIRAVPHNDAARLIVASHPWPPPFGAPLKQRQKLLPAIYCCSLSALIREWACVRGVSESSATKRRVPLAVGLPGGERRTIRREAPF
jgi:hypothetical protein